MPDEDPPAPISRGALAASVSISGSTLEGIGMRMAPLTPPGTLLRFESLNSTAE